MSFSENVGKIVCTPVHSVQHVLRFMESKIGHIWDILHAHTTHVIRREVVDMGKMDMWRHIDVKAAASQTMCNLYHCSTQQILYPGIIGHFNPRCPASKNMMWSTVSNCLLPWFDNFIQGFKKLLSCSESITPSSWILVLFIGDYKLFGLLLDTINHLLELLLDTFVWTFVGYN